MQDINHECDPVYAKVDHLLDVLTKSKALHILLELHLSNRSMGFTEIKKRVDSSSTTVSRRLDELESFNLINQIDDNFLIMNTKGHINHIKFTSLRGGINPSDQHHYDEIQVVINRFT